MSNTFLDAKIVNNQRLLASAFLCTYNFKRCFHKVL